MLPDVSGRIPLAATILPGGPPTVPLRSPAQRLLSAALATGVPVALSRDAGRYLCNYLCWRAAEAAGTGAPSLVAFVHVPTVRRASSQSRRDLLTLDKLIDAGEAILRAAVGAAR
jgi:pyroglutamyl-peptidase